MTRLSVVPCAFPAVDRCRRRVDTHTLYASFGSLDGSLDGSGANEPILAAGSCEQSRDHLPMSAQKSTLPLLSGKLSSHWRSIQHKWTPSRTSIHSCWHCISSRYVSQIAHTSLALYSATWSMYVVTMYMYVVNMYTCEGSACICDAEPYIWKLTHHITTCLPGNQ